MQRKIAAYCRVSTEEQANLVEGSLDNQRYRAKSYIDLKNSQEKGWGDIIEYYIDDGYSAKDTNRPAYQRMITDLKKKKIDFILVSDLSRLSRNLNDFCDLLGFLEKQKSNFLSIKEQFDTSTSVGRLMVYLVITLAQFEREQTSERVALGVYARGMRGIMNGVRPILGYDKDPTKPGSYIVNEKAAQEVSRIFDVYLESGSKSKTIERLNDIGIRPKLHENYKRQKESDRWTFDTLGTLLSNAAYIGYHEVNKRNKHLPQESLKQNQRYQLVKASWPAIVSEHVFYQVKDQLEVSKQLERTRVKDAKPRLYILSGTFKCGQCGEPLVGQTYHGEYSTYRYYGHTTTGSKHGCDIQRVSADEVEEVVLKYLKRSFADTGYLEHLARRISDATSRTISSNNGEAARVKTEIGGLEQEARNVFCIQAQGSFGPEALKLMSDRLEEIGKKKASLTKYLIELDQKTDECVDASKSAKYITEKFVNFENGFSKATNAQKKRLIQKTIKQIALTKDGLALWFYLTDSDEIPGRKLKLIRDEAAKGGLALYIEPGATRLDRSLDICGSGAP